MHVPCSLKDSKSVVPQKKDFFFLLWALFICIERGKQATRWLVHTVQSPNLEEAINL